MRRPPEWQPYARCVVCGFPASDHISFGYWVKPWLLHMLPARIARWLRPLRR